MEQQKAETLAREFNGDAWNSGGGVYLVTIQIGNNVLAISDEVVGMYPDVESVGDESLLIGEVVMC